MKNSKLSTLFNPGEFVFYKERAEQVGGALLVREEGPPPQAQFYCVNPVNKQAATLEALTSFRNIVVEFDSGTVEAQWKLVTSKLNMPFTLCTFSGARSLHFILSLEEACSSLEEYRDLVKDIYVGVGGSADPKCKNPNRLTRVPGNRRHDNGVEQELVAARGRVGTTELQDWLNSGPVLERITKQRQAEARQQAIWDEKRAGLAEGMRPPLPGYYKELVEEGRLSKELKGRHDALVKMAAWCGHNKYKAPEVKELLERAAGSLGIEGRGDATKIFNWWLDNF